jgi:hypothetical protein
LGALLLENNARDVLKVARNDRSLGRKEASPKFTPKCASTGTKTQGWKMDGIRRYNEYVAVTGRGRNHQESKKFENNLVHYYCQVNKLEINVVESLGNGHEMGDDGNNLFGQVTCAAIEDFEDSQQEFVDMLPLDHDDEEYGGLTSV